jgi:hypothetical protein
VGTSLVQPKTRALAVSGRCSTSESCSIDRGTPLSSTHSLSLRLSLGSTIRKPQWPIHATPTRAPLLLHAAERAFVCCRQRLPPGPTAETGDRGTRHNGELAGAAECTCAMSQASSRGSSRVSSLRPPSTLHTTTAQTTRRRDCLVESLNLS